MVDNCSRYGLEGPTGVLSSLGGVKVTECQSANEDIVGSGTRSSNRKVCSIGNDIPPWIEPLHY